jgi:cytochrome oxidase Cu insertion factor (SCO1/SenC/PrrC family)
MFRIALVLAVLLALAAPAAAQLPVGADAPNFTLQDTQGVPYTLSDYADQVVVLFFVGYG